MSGRVTLSGILGHWTVDPLLCSVLCLTLLMYGWGVSRCPTRWAAWRAASFAAGLLVIALALLSGIDTYADELLSMHVLQHLLLILIAPVLLLAGAPVRLALRASAPPGRRAIGALLRRRTAHLLTRPSFGFAIFAAAVLGTHLTATYELALRDPAVHVCEHAALLWSGLLFLAPLLAADPVPRPPGAIARFSWLMAAMVVMAVPAGVFLLDGSVRYPFYLAPARALHLSALSDQRNAGLLMLIGGGVVMGVLAILIAMSAMLAEERRQRRRDSYAAAREPARKLAGL